jgi:hypothetical protein
VTWLSGHGLAKSIGCQIPFFSSASHELKSQPKNELIVRVVSPSSASSSSTGSPRREVALVQRLRRVVLDRPRLRADPDAAHEAVEGEDALLQVHHELARFVVGVAQRLLVVDLVDPDPAAAVEGLHEERVAEVLAHLSEVEELRVALERHLQVRLLLVRLRRDQPGRRDRQPEAHHRAVRRVLLVRLHRPRVVEDVDAVQDHGLLDPLAAEVVPVRQPVDHHVVLRRIVQPEGIDGHARDLEAHRVAPDLEAQVELLDDLLVADRPADVGSEREPDLARDLSQGTPPELRAV